MTALTRGLYCQPRAIGDPSLVLFRSNTLFFKNADKLFKEEFEKQSAGKPYKTLNDVETSPAGKLSDEDLAHHECCIHAAMEHFGIKEHE